MRGKIDHLAYETTQGIKKYDIDDDDDIGNIDADIDIIDDNNYIFYHDIDIIYDYEDIIADDIAVVHDIDVADDIDIIGSYR